MRARRRASRPGCRVAEPDSRPPASCEDELSVRRRRRPRATRAGRCACGERGRDADGVARLDRAPTATVVSAASQIRGSGGYGAEPQRARTRPAAETSQASVRPAQDGDWLLDAAPRRGACAGSRGRNSRARSAAARRAAGRRRSRRTRRGSLPRAARAPTESAPRARAVRPGPRSRRSAKSGVSRAIT